MLRSLELFGFKSFADRTKFEFAPGITCVVGPNGSGKSNVVDAIKWILGDQSPKSLRGKEMTDVIFNGSASRKPAGFAEALLTFDNARRVLAVDADEVQVGRRIYRSGEAEYLINRVPARLKDVRDLFLGTGAGTSAYSIIEQGRVDQLLQASNLSRRNVFEEAAGISRFKVKKIEAQRKLERVAQNLLRLTDIVQEVETQLQTLRSQAAKAAKFRELSQELRTLRLGSAADDFRELASHLARLEARLQELAAGVEQLAHEARDCEARQQAAESHLAEAEDRLRAAERREAENREVMAGYDATVRHQTARRQELETEYTRLKKQQADLAERAEVVAGELQQTEFDLEKFADELKCRRDTLSVQADAIGDLSGRLLQRRERLEAQRAALLDSVRRISAGESRCSALEVQVETRQAATTLAQARLAELDQAQAGQDRQCAQRQAALAAVLSEQTGLKEQIQVLASQRNELLAQQAAIQATLAERREQRGAAQARKLLLEDMERRQEGLGVGVKEILALARSAQGPPWSHVRGHVVDLLEVDLENAALLEVALGARAHLIVLDDAEPLLDFLNSGQARVSGRVGFLTLARDVRGAVAFPRLAASDDELRPDLSAKPGVVCRADQLIRNSAGIPQLAAQLLADTWIVTSLDAGLALLAADGGDCRFVTLQGELLEPGGLLYIGTLRSETALVSRKSELRGMRQELAQLDRQIADEEQRIAEIAARLRDSARDEQHAQFDLDLCAHRVAELRNEANAAEFECDRTRQLRTDVMSEIERVEIELSDLRPRLATAQAELAQIGAGQQQLEHDIAVGDVQIGADETRLGELQGLAAAEQRDLATYEERLQNLQHARSRLDEERLQRDLHRDEAERRFRVLADKRNQIEVEIVETASALSQLASLKDGLAAEVAELQKEREQARRLRGELAERDLAARHRLRDLREQAHALEMQTTDVKHQINHLADRLRDEYQVELTEVVASGATARPAAAEAVRPPTSPPAAPGGSTQDDLSPEQSRAEVEEQINRLRRKIKQLGQVSTDSLNELDELENRFARLSSQLQDLVEARNTLEEIIRRINTESKRMFVETFDEVRGNFQELFRKLFGGGEGDVVLENPDDVLECGIDVVARPPGKELRSISLLSGGEKTMTAVALLLAIFKTKPSPFCILDEVDAALDEGNVGRYLGVIQEFREWTQFIIVSHRKPTMAGADVLYGVTMEEAGVSKRMSVRFEDVGDDGQFKTPGPTRATRGAAVESAA